VLGVVLVVLGLVVALDVEVLLEVFALFLLLGLLGDREEALDVLAQPQVLLGLGGVDRVGVVDQLVLVDLELGVVLDPEHLHEVLQHLHVGLVGLGLGLLDHVLYVLLDHVVEAGQCGDFGCDHQVLVEHPLEDRRDAQELLVGADVVIEVEGVRTHLGQLGLEQTLLLHLEFHQLVLVELLVSAGLRLAFVCVLVALVALVALVGLLQFFVAEVDAVEQTEHNLSGLLACDVAVADLLVGAQAVEAGGPRVFAFDKVFDGHHAILLDAQQLGGVVARERLQGQFLGVDLHEAQEHFVDVEVAQLVRALGLQLLVLALLAVQSGDGGRLALVDLPGFAHHPLLLASLELLLHSELELLLLVALQVLFDHLGFPVLRVLADLRMLDLDLVFDELSQIRLFADLLGAQSSAGLQARVQCRVGVPLVDFVEDGVQLQRVFEFGLLNVVQFH